MVMVVDDEIIHNNRAKAITWMKRFIKMYKYEPETVTVNGSEIKWADGIYWHNIHFKGDKFVIDGSEFDIDKELWDLYFRMRELTGSILILPPFKFIAQRLSNRIKQVFQKVR